MLCSQKPWGEETIIQELQRKGSFAYGINKDDVLIGYALAYTVLDELNIVDVGVRPEYRGKGVGTELMTCMLKNAAHINVKKVFLEVRKSNEAAIRLYKKLGFSVVFTRKNYYQDNGEDALIMDCMLKSSSN